MPEFEEDRLLTAAAADTPELAEGDYCEITSRIVIVSPRPAALRALVAELAVRCYDVLLLHHADDPLLDKLQGDIVIVDRTADSLALPAAIVRYDSGPVVSLTKPGAVPRNRDEVYVPWPSPIDGIVSRLKELAAAQRPAATADSQFYVFKNVHMDINRMTVSRAGVRVDLTKTEFDLLRALIAADGKVMSRQELMDEVWGEQYFGGSNSVDVHIRSLRHKLQDDPRTPTYIATVRGAGYRLADG